MAVDSSTAGLSRRWPIARGRPHTGFSKAILGERYTNSMQATNTGEMNNMMK